MINFSKSFFAKASDKSSQMISPEMSFGKGIRETGEEYTEKDFTGGLSFDQMEGMYKANVWVRAIIDKIVERICDIRPIVKSIKAIDDNNNKLNDGVKKQIEEIQEFLEKPNDNNETFDNIRRKIHRDLLVFDGTALEIIGGASTKRKIVEIYNVSGDSVKINTDKRGKLKKKAYLQVDESLSIVAYWKKEDMIYYLLNPRANRTYGFSPMESLYQTVTAELYASQYNLDFFKNQATPRFAVLMEGLGIGQGQAAMERFKLWWNRELKGQPHKPIILGTEQGKIEFKQIGLSNEEMQFQEYSSWLLMKIMVVFKMQMSVLGLAGKPGVKPAESVDQVNQFKVDAVKPQLTTFANKFNQQIIFSANYFGSKDVYLDFDLDIVDKKAQAEWHEKYLRSGVITINEIRVHLGMISVPWGNVPYLQNNLVPFGQNKDGTTSAVPNDQSANPANKPNVPDVAVASKSEIEQYIGRNVKFPIGWEGLELNEKMNILTEIMKIRETELSKMYSYGDN